MENTLTQKIYAIVVLAVLLASASASASIFNFIFHDVDNETGINFDDPVHGEERRATLEAVSDYISSVIDAPGTADVIIGDFDVFGNRGVAAAFPGVIDAPPRFTNGAAYDHIVGTDTDPDLPDGYVAFNFREVPDVGEPTGFVFDAGLDAPAADQYDLFTVALHELTHVLGVISLLTADGGSSQPNPLSDTETGFVYSKFDSFLVTGDGRPLFNDDNGATFIGTEADLTSDDIYFDSPQARNANGGEPIKIFAPGTFLPGSSISHVDNAMYPDALMGHTLATGKMVREFTIQDQAILETLGYDFHTPVSVLAAVPEPVTSLTGLVLLGVVSLRRR